MCLLALAGACGGGDNKDYGAPIPVDVSVTAAAEDAVFGAQAVTTLSTNPDSQSIGAFGNLFDDVNIIVQAKMNARAGKTALEALRKAMARTPVDSACVNVSGNTITFTSCSSEGITFNGTINFGSGHFGVNLTLTGSSNGLNLNIGYTGSIDASVTAVAGSLSIGGSVSGTSGGVAVSGNLSYATSLAVTLTGDCATAGQLEAHAVVNLHGSGTGGTVNESANLWAKAVYGPTCHTVTIY
jgi:hypothetical protein